MERYKKRGWFNESHRHSLAARGISTAKYLARKTLYHGTAKKNVAAIRRGGLPRGSFLSLDPKQAEWFGKDHGEPAVMKVNIDDEKLVAFNPFTGEMRKIRPDMIDSLDDEEYLQYNEYIPSTDIDAYPASKIDLKRYMGEWNQESVNKTPWYQKDCEDVTATYELMPNGSSVKVTNRCMRDGEIDSVQGLAYPITADNRKLIVQFGNSIFRTGKYEIVDVNDDYTRAVVKSGDTKWVLTRNGNKMMAKKLSKNEKKAKFERCVKAVAKKNPDGKSAAYPICTDSLGYQVQDGKLNYQAKKEKKDFIDAASDVGANVLKKIFYDVPKAAYKRGKQ